MKPWRLVLAVLALCAGCADGGPAGTGIAATSAISGNVIDVQDGSGGAGADADAQSVLPPIVVSIDGLPDVTTMADSNGNFALSGSFAGSLTLRFTVPQFQVAQQLEVPAGSTVVLQDIELEPEGIVAQAAQQLDFFGTVDLTDCENGILLVHEHRANATQYLVHVDDETSFVDARGQSQTCRAVRLHSTVAIEGGIAYAGDRTITALTVTITSRPPSRPQPLLQVPIRGTVNAIDCALGLVVVDDTHQRTRLQLTPTTRITRANGLLTCSDLHLGDPLRGQGVINLRMPGTALATTLVVTGPPATAPLRFVGVVTAIDCVRGLLQLLDVTNTIALHLSPTTAITRDGRRLVCSDLQPGNRVTGVGQPAAGAPEALEAIQLDVRRRRSFSAHLTSSRR